MAGTVNHFLIEWCVMYFCLVREQSLIQKLPSPFSHRNWKRKRGRERRRGKSWSGTARSETRSARGNANDGTVSGRRTERGSERESGSARKKEIETASAQKSVIGRESGRETEAATAAKTAVNPGTRDVTSSSACVLISECIHSLHFIHRFSHQSSLPYLLTIFLQVYIYTYIYIHTYIHAYTHTYIYIYIYIHTYSGYGKYSDPLKFFTLCYIAAIC